MRMKVRGSTQTSILEVDDFRSVAGYKSAVLTHHNYVVVVSSPSTATATTPVTRKLATTVAAVDGDASKVTVFDMENKVIGYTGMFAEGIREVISEWGNIYILTNDGQVRPYVMYWCLVP